MKSARAPCAGVRKRQPQGMRTRDIIRLIYGGLLVAKGAKVIVEVLKKLKR